MSGTGAGEANVPLAGGQQPVRNKLFGVCMFILIVEMTERLCYYTIYPVFPQYLTHAGPKPMSSGAANALKQSFRMLAYLFPLVGGYLADNIFGRYKTILYFTICYVIGTVLIAVGAIPGLMTAALGPPIFLLGAFVFTAIGTGAIKPNVVNFGAEQYDITIPEEVDQQKAFFSYFYMTINIGSIFASIWLAGLATSKVSQAGPGNGFFLAYLAAAIAMCLSLLSFLAGTGRYSAASKMAPTKKPMISIIRKHLTESSHWRAKATIAGMLLVLVSLVTNLVGALLPESVALPAIGANPPNVPGMDVLSLITFVLASLSCGMIIAANTNIDWVQPLRSGTGAGITTEEVRGFLRAMPTIIAVSIGFNMCYNGMDIYQQQACQMDTRTGFSQTLNEFFFLQGGQFNGVFFGLGDNASIIICIPILEMWVFPALKRMRGGKPVSRMAKFNAGFFFAILGCVVGMIIEIIRKKKALVGCDDDLLNDGACFCATGVADDMHYMQNFTAHIFGNDTFTPPPEQVSSMCAAVNGTLLLIPKCAPVGVPMSEMTAWWTFIPYWITGMGEILVNPVVQEFSFDEVSPTLRSVLMGVTMVVQGCLPAVFEGAFTGFIPTDLNLGNVNIVYIVFIVLSLVLLVITWLIALPERSEREAEGTLA